MSHCLHSLKGGFEGLSRALFSGLIKGHTRSLGYGSYGLWFRVQGLGSRESYTGSSRN